jgi:adenylosuccinate synthase
MSPSRGNFLKALHTPCGRSRRADTGTKLTVVPATVIVGAQWGDEGKGKIVDLLALDSDVVCRYQGGPNAGHTIVRDGETFALHHVPSGILSGKLCVVGAGCVVDPGLLVGELEELEARGISTEPVRISGNAHLIMPWHVAIDSASERRLGRLQIGTTRRGIGPAYADKAARIGIRLQDVLDPKILRQKFETTLAEKNVVLERIHGVAPLQLEELAVSMESCAARLRPYVADTSLLVDRALREGRRVLLEGAQGTLLDLDHGTYPFVTSSSPIAGAATTGVGIGPTRIDRVLGVAKAYVTRVGEGPFPTEIGDSEQERVRELGAEYGTTTGRERRCGWLDLVGLRFAVRLNGMTSLALTKIDVLSAFAELPVCTRYRLPDGSETEEFPEHQSDFHHAEPVYETLPGWLEPLEQAESLADLPAAARDYVAFVEARLGIEVSLISVGAERERVVAPRGLASVAG